MDDLVEWLRAQLDVDERLAEIIRCGGYAAPTWHCRPGRSGRWIEIYQMDRLNIEPEGSEADEGGGPIALVMNGRNEHEHIANWDPARVLREVEAKRQRIKWAMNYWADADSADGTLRVLAQAARQVLQMEAFPYAGRPGFREEWWPAFLDSDRPGCREEWRP